jgi:hypothetical protein
MHLIDQQLNLMIRGRFDEAWKLSEKLEQLDPDDLRHRFNRGWFLINQGKFQEGFQSLEAGRFLNVYGGIRLPTTKPIWKQQNLKNKTVIINLEGGLGDQIIFARFANEIKKRGGKCILCCDARLHNLFLRIEGVERCIELKDVQSVKHHYWIPGFSCSWLFGHTFDTLPNNPYVYPNDSSVELWKGIINSKKIKVGIRWSGNTKFEHQQFRIFPPEKLINLNKYSDIQFYSLQRDTDTRELPKNVVDLQHLLISMEDTAAVIANLDLVITSCTSIAHLSSAMGKPTWVIVPILPYHIWAYGNDTSPWYQDTTKVYRQEKFSNWDRTFVKLEKDLVDRFDLTPKNNKVKRLLQNEKKI